MKYAAGFALALAFLAAVVALPTPLGWLDAALVSSLALSPDEHGWSVALWLTGLGDGTAVLVGMAAVSLMLLRAGEMRLVLLLWGGCLISRLVTDGLKLLIARPRPAMSDTVQLIVQADGFSFPSGHATSAGYLYGFLALLVLCSSSRLRGGTGAAAGLGVLALAVAASRVALGVHYPSDVVAGLLSAGVALALVAPRFGQGAPGAPFNRRA